MMNRPLAHAVSEPLSQPAIQTSLAHMAARVPSPPPVFALPRHREVADASTDLVDRAERTRRKVPEDKLCFVLRPTGQVNPDGTPEKIVYSVPCPDEPKKKSSWCFLF